MNNRGEFARIKLPDGTIHTVEIMPDGTYQTEDGMKGALSVDELESFRRMLDAARKTYGESILSPYDKEEPVTNENEPLKAVIPVSRMFIIEDEDAAKEEAQTPESSVSTSFMIDADDTYEDIEKADEEVEPIPVPTPAPEPEVTPVEEDVSWDAYVSQNAVPLNSGKNDTRENNSPEDNELLNSSQYEKKETKKPKENKKSQEKNKPERTAKPKQGSVKDLFYIIPMFLAVIVIAYGLVRYIPSIGTSQVPETPPSVSESYDSEQTDSSASEPATDSKDTASSDTSSQSASSEAQPSTSESQSANSQSDTSQNSESNSESESVPGSLDYIIIVPSESGRSAE